MKKWYSEWKLGQVEFSEHTYVSCIVLFNRKFFVVEEIDIKPF